MDRDDDSGRPHPLHPDAPIRLSDDDELRRQDQKRATVTVADLVAEAGEAAFEPVELVEFDPERPDDATDGADTPDGKRRPRTIASVLAVAHMRGIMRIGTELGVRYVEMPGWTTRGRSILTPRYTIAHHTAAERDIDIMLRDGRSDLPGPLCNWAGHNDLAVVAVAAGRANHCGVATVTSDEAYGYEQTGPVPTGSTGSTAFPSYRAAILHQAATCIYHGWSVGNVLFGHKEIARPLGRKVDPMFPMDSMRSAVITAIRNRDTPDTPTDEGLAILLAGITEADEQHLAEGVKRGVSAALTIDGQLTAGGTMNVLIGTLKDLARSQAVIAEQLKTLVANTTVPPAAR
jgi:hypothetical protein